MSVYFDNLITKTVTETIIKYVSLKITKSIGMSDYLPC